jgi:signal transduction histidine kinase
LERRLWWLFGLAVFAPAGLLAWVGWRSLESERAAAARDAAARASLAERQVAEDAESSIASLERGFAEVCASARGGSLRQAVEAFASRSRLVAGTFLTDEAGRLVVPRDRLAAPGVPAPGATQAAAWQRIAHAADGLLATGSATGATEARQLLEVSLPSFASPALRAGLQRRLAEALARAGDAAEAVRRLTALTDDPIQRSSREPGGLPQGPAAFTRLAELQLSLEQREAAVGTLSDLIALAHAGSLGLDPTERTVAVEAARRILARELPARADAVAKAAIGEARLARSVRDALVPQLGTEGLAMGLAGVAGQVRVELTDEADGPRLLSVGRTAGGALAGFEIALDRLAVALEDAAGRREEAGAAPVRLLRSPPDGTARPARRAPGRALSGTVSRWRVVAAATQSPRRDGRVRTLQLTAAAVAFGLIVAAASALLAMRTLRRQMALVRLRREFTENVTHELRTPLTSIRSLAEVLVRADGGLPAERTQRYFREILGQSERLSALVENVLDASRVERGALRLAPEDTDPRALVRCALTAFARMPEGAGREVEVHDAGAPTTLRLDAAAATHALTNLLSNAGKYSPATSTIDVVAETLEDGPGVRLRVRDRGEGVPPALVPRLFEPWWRRHPEDPARRGSGLGLRVARELARAHRGDVRHEHPTDGCGGSDFVLELRALPRATAAGDGA